MPAKSYELELKASSTVAEYCSTVAAAVARVATSWLSVLRQPLKVDECLSTRAPSFPCALRVNSEFSQTPLSMTVCVNGMFII